MRTPDRNVQQHFSILSEAQAMVETDKSDPVKDNELYQAFKLFDADGDGFVSLEEFTRAMEVCLIFSQLTAHSRQNP